MTRYLPLLDSPFNAAYERLLRRLLALPPCGAAVVAVTSYSYNLTKHQFGEVRACGEGAAGCVTRAGLLGSESGFGLARHSCLCAQALASDEWVGGWW